MGIYRAFLEEEVPHLDSTNDPDGQIAELEKIVKDSDANEEEQNDAQEAAFGPDGGVDDIMAESWLAIAEFESGNNDIMKAIGYHELNEAVEGREFLFESMEDVKGFFKTAKDKIIAFFKKVWSVIQRWTGNLTASVTSNKKFAQKYASQITEGAKTIKTEKGRKAMKGYSFAGLDKAISGIDNNAAKTAVTAVTKDGSEVNKSPEASTAFVNKYRGTLANENGEISQGEFASKLKNKLFGDSEPKEMWMEAKDVIDILSNKKDNLEAVKKFAKESRDEFKRCLETVKDLEAKVSRREVKTDAERTARTSDMSDAIRAVNIVKSMMSSTQIWRSQMIHAVNARGRQARRYGMAYVAAANKKKNKGFNKDDHWSESATEYGFLGNLGLV